MLEYNLEKAADSLVRIAENNGLRIWVHEGYYANTFYFVSDVRPAESYENVSAGSNPMTVPYCDYSILGFKASVHTNQLSLGGYTLDYATAKLISETIVPLVKASEQANNLGIPFDIAGKKTLFIDALKRAYKKRGRRLKVIPFETF